MSMMFAFEGADLFALPTGTRLLNGLYEIIEPLQEGGFSMTYVARDSLERHVVIKECFPAGICTRMNGQVQAISPDMTAKFEAVKKEFLREARGVATLKHPYIVNVYQVFEENNTAYMALEYVAGMDLISVLEQEPERLTPRFIETALRETLKAVCHIHANGVLHRDIAPDNIRVDAAGRITLIDFGASRPRDFNPASVEGSITATKTGYSPPEFYDPAKEQGFWSDLYSVAATFYHLIKGDAPPDGLVRQEQILRGQPDPYEPLMSGRSDFGIPILVTIDRALQVKRSSRPQTAERWLAALDGLPKPAEIRSAVRPSATSLDAAISAMVRDSNQTLAPVAALVERVENQRKISDVQPNKPERKQWFDIIGNPIANLDEWVRQEETPLQTKATPAIEDPVSMVSELVDAERRGELLLAENTRPLAAATKKPFLAGFLPLFAPRRSRTC